MNVHTVLEHLESGPAPGFAHMCWPWFNFFLQLCDVFLQVAGVFSKFRSRACTYRSAPGPRLLQFGIWYHTVWSCWVQAITIGCVLCLCACKMHHYAYGCIGWCLHNPVWIAMNSPTKTFKGCILQPDHGPDVLCYISPVRRDWKFESSVQLVSFVFRSLLYTTEASNVQANLPLCPLWLSSVCCRGEDRLWSMMRTMIPQSFRRIPNQRMHNNPRNYRSQGLVSGTATERPRLHT